MTPDHQSPAATAHELVAPPWLGQHPRFGEVDRRSVACRLVNGVGWHRYRTKAALGRHGHDRVAASSPDTADRYVMAIMDRCDRLADFPMVGVAHDDIRPGLRTLGYRRRAVIAFTVTVTEATVEIIGVVEAESVAAPTTGPHPANPRRSDLLRGP